MDKWARAVVASLPPGAVARIPTRASHQTVKRSVKLPNTQTLTPALSLRYLNKHGIDNYSAAKKPLLTSQHKKNRNKFAQKLVTYDWSQV